MTRVAAICAIAALLALGAAKAAVLPPQTIDAGTGADAVDVGAAFGNQRAWVAFVQQTNGVARLYVARAQRGVFAAPALADDPVLSGGGFPVTGAALAGNASGDGLVVYTYTDSSLQSPILARRLANGQLGEETVITPPGTNGALPQLALGLHHRRLLAENDSGVAALCYVDPATNDAYAAVAAAGSNSWTRYGPLMSTTCEDIGVDARGDVIVIGQDANMRTAADRIVGGVLHSEEIDANARDEESLALAADGTALVFARTTSGNDFDASAWRMRDIAAGGAWESLGPVDAGVRQPGENTEYVRGALSANGKGVLTFRVNDPAAGTSALYWETVDAGGTQPLALPEKLADVDVGADAIPQVDARGYGFALYDAHANETPTPTLQPLGTGDAVQLATGAYGSFCVPCFQVDAGGNYLALVRQGANPQRLVAVFGTFASAKPHLRAIPARVRRGGSVTLLGRGFGAGARVALYLVPRRGYVRRPVAYARALATGAFRYRLRIATHKRRGRYVAVACQAACTTKATTEVTIR